MPQRSVNDTWPDSSAPVATRLRVAEAVLQRASPRESSSENDHDLARAAASGSTATASSSASAPSAAVSDLRALSAGLSSRPIYGRHSMTGSLALRAESRITEHSPRAEVISRQRSAALRASVHSLFPRLSSARAT